MTDKEIIQALECCISPECENCPYDGDDLLRPCNHNLMKDALDLINSQQAEIEKLKKDKDGLAVAFANAVGRNVGFKEDIERLQNDLAISRKETKRYATRRAEAIKEFAKRLKATPMRFLVEYVEYYDKPSIDKMVLFIDDNDIDNLVKEMVGEDK